MSGVPAPSFATQLSQILKETLFDQGKFLSFDELNTQQIGISAVERQTDQAFILYSPDPRGWFSRLTSKLTSWRHSAKPLPPSTIITALLSHIYTGVASTSEPAERLFEAMTTDPQAIPELVSLLEVHLLTTQILHLYGSIPLEGRLMDDPEQFLHVTLVVDQLTVPREAHTSLAALIRKERDRFLPSSFVEKDLQNFLDRLQIFITKQFTDQLCLLLQGYLTRSEWAGGESWTPSVKELNISPLEHGLIRIQYRIELTGKQPQNRAAFLVWLTVSNRGLLRKIEVYLPLLEGITKIDDDFPLVFECTSAWLARCAFIRPALDGIVEGLMKRLSTIVVYEAGQVKQAEAWLKEKLHADSQEVLQPLLLQRLSELAPETSRMLGVCLACSEQVQQFATEVPERAPLR